MKRRRHAPKAVARPKKTGSPTRTRDRSSYRIGNKTLHLDRVRRILEDPVLPPQAAPTPSADRLFVADAELDEAPQPTLGADPGVGTGQDAVAGDAEAEPGAGPSPDPGGEDQPPTDSADRYESLRLRWEQEPPETED